MDGPDQRIVYGMGGPDQGIVYGMGGPDHRIVYGMDALGNVCVIYMVCVGWPELFYAWAL